MTEAVWLNYITAIGSVATPILVLILTAVGWRIRQRLDRRLELEDKLREDRIATYNQILEPFIILLMTDAAWKLDRDNKGRNKQELAMEKLMSLKYREQGFRLSLFGSDAVVRAYNDLMQYFFRRGEQPQPLKTTAEADVKDMMGLLGSFLLEIRRGIGNESTQLSKWDMLEWFVKDARAFRS